MQTGPPPQPAGKEKKGGEREGRCPFLGSKEAAVIKQLTSHKKNPGRHWGKVLEETLMVIGFEKHGQVKKGGKNSRAPGEIQASPRQIDSSLVSARR